jgi:hypothetical protein
MNNFISFAVVVFMLSVPLFSLSAFGADNVTSNKSQITVDQFVTYDNSTRGIKIDYPKGWTVIDQFGLGFFSPKENDSDTFREGLLVSKGPHGNQSIDKLGWSTGNLQFIVTKLQTHRIKGIDHSWKSSSKLDIYV